MSTYNDQNDSWNREQAPFAGAETPAEVRAAAAEAAAEPEVRQAGAAPASGQGTAYSAIPPAGTAAGPGVFAPGSFAPGSFPPGGAGPYSTGPSASNPYASSGAASWQPVGGYAGPVPPPGGAVPVAVPAGGPSPALAFFLGLIPGVGAMYNGQVAKGFVHLIVFAVLVTITNSIDIFGWFIAAWIFFMAFEAYHTAKARRDGLPLPNAFGWNDIGERVGLGRNWPGSPAAPSAPGVVPPTGTPQGGVPTGPPVGWSSVPPVSQAGPYPGAAPYVNPVPNWAGYVPPAAFPGSGVPLGGSAAPSGSVPPTPGTQGAPYMPVHGTDPYAAAPMPDPSSTSSRLPTGAIWLIGLGVLFLLGQWTPLLRWSHVWVPSLLLAGLAVFLFARRMGWTGSPLPVATTALPPTMRAAVALRAPGALLAIAVLNGLDQARVVRWSHSWPVLLIAIGVLMLVERAAWRQAASMDPAISAVPSPVPPSGPAQNGGF